MSSRRGNLLENRCADIVRDEGWFCICGRASRGPADILAAKAGELPRLIQVKGDQGSPYANFRTVDRLALLDAALQAGGTAELMWWPRGRKEPLLIPARLWPVPKGVK